MTRQPPADDDPGPPVPPAPDGFYRKVLDHFPEGVYFVDKDRRITYWNRGAERITGFPADDVVGHRCPENILMHVDGQGCWLCEGTCPLLQAIQDGRDHEAEVFLHHRSGHRVPVVVRTSPLRDESGAVVGALEVFTDNPTPAATRRRIEELQAQAMLDSLTGLANRRYGEVELAARLAELRRYGWRFAVLFLDLDGFKRVNDRFDHATGDEALRMVARTLQTNTRRENLVCRWGGEEFVAVLSNTDETRLPRVAEIFRMLVERSGLHHERELIRVTVSIGATIATPDDTPESLIARADRLMYQSKSAGKNRVTVG